MTSPTKQTQFNINEIEDLKDYFDIKIKTFCTQITDASVIIDTQQKRYILLNLKDLTLFCTYWGRN